MSEIANFGTIILLVSAGFGLALLSSKLTERLPIPPPAVFLIAAAAASDIWPSLYHHTPIHTVERVAVVALIVILFNGGLDIGWPSFHESAVPDSCSRCLRHVHNRRRRHALRPLRAGFRVDAGGYCGCRARAY